MQTKYTVNKIDLNFGKTYRVMSLGKTYNRIRLKISWTVVI